MPGACIAVPRVAILGAGAWGTALANLAAAHGPAALWSRDATHAAEMTACGVNARRLPGIALRPGVEPTGDLGLALAGAGAVLLAVPAQQMRALAERVAPLMPPGVPAVICAKGIERGSGLTMDEVLAQALPRNPPAILSGPSFAEDVARGLPTAVTLAAGEMPLAEALARALAAPWFRLYASTDLRGVSIGGSTKNVLAIACGIAAGRRLGASAGAALIARGFAELRRFGLANGALAETLTGLSGLGDLVLTCGSAQSRNFALGFSLGEGTDLAAARARAGTVEGAQTCAILCALAERQGIDMPIARAVDAVLTGRAGVDEAVGSLLSRPLRADTAG